MFFRLAVVAAFTLSGCEASRTSNASEKGAEARSRAVQEPGTADSSIASPWFTRAMGIASGESICRLQLSNAPAPMTIFNNLGDRGVLACRFNDQVDIYYKKNESQCSAEAFQLDGEPVDSAWAESRIRQCTPLGQVSAPGNKDVVIITPTSLEYDSGLPHYDTFLMDVYGLSLRDALNISHLSSFDNVICMETDDPEGVIDHIVKADIVSGEIADYAFYEGSCREIGRQITGSTWPETVDIESQ